MSLQLENGSPKEQAAAIARDIAVAVASTLGKTAIYDRASAEKYANVIAQVYETMFAAALKSIKE